MRVRANTPAPEQCGSFKRAPIEKRVPSWSNLPKDLLLLLVYRSVERSRNILASFLLFIPAKEKKGSSFFTDPTKILIRRNGFCIGASNKQDLLETRILAYSDGRHMPLDPLRSCKWALSGFLCKHLLLFSESSLRFRYLSRYSSSGRHAGRDSHLNKKK